MAVLYSSISSEVAANLVCMDITNLLAELEGLDRLLEDRENQTDPNTLQLSQSVMADVAEALGVSKNALGPLLGVSDDKSVRAWFSGRQTPRRGALRIARMLVERLIQKPSDAACMEAIAPHLDSLLNRARGAGWDDAEVVRIIRSWQPKITN